MVLLLLAPQVMVATKETAEAVVGVAVVVEMLAAILARAQPIVERVAAGAVETLAAIRALREATYNTVTLTNAWPTAA